MLSAVQGSLNGGVGGNYGIVTKIDDRGILQWRVLTEANHLPKAMTFTGTEIEVVGQRVIDSSTESSPDPATSFVFRVRLDGGGTFARSDYTGSLLLGAASSNTFEDDGRTVLVGKDTEALDAYTFYENIGGAGNGQQKQSFPIQPPGDNTTFVYEGAADISGQGTLILGKAGDRGALIVVQGTGRRRYLFDQGTRLLRAAKTGDDLVLVVGEENDNPKIWLLNSAYKILETYSWSSNAVRDLGNVVVKKNDGFDNVYVSATTSNGIPSILHFAINHEADGSEYIDRTATKQVTVSAGRGVTSSPPQIALSQGGRFIVYGTDRTFSLDTDEYPDAESYNSNWLQVGKLSFDLKQSCLSLVDPGVTYTMGINQQLSAEPITAGAGDNPLVYKKGFNTSAEGPSDVTQLSYCDPIYFDCYTQQCPGETYGRFAIAWPATCPPAGGQSIFARVTDPFGRTVATRENVRPDQPINFDLSGRPTGRYFIEVACGTPGQPGRVLFTSTVVVIPV